MDGEITYELEGEFEGVEITPDHVPSKILSSLIENLSNLVKTVGEREKKTDVILSIRKGSLNLAAKVSTREENTINSELKVIFQKEDLAYAPSERRGIYENLLKIAEDKEWKGSLSAGNEKYEFNKQTLFKPNVEDIWIDMELYLYGEITDLGGTFNTNIHLKADNGKTYTINCTKENLREDKINRLYKETGLRVNAKYNIKNKEYKDYSFIEFVKYKPEFKSEKLRKSFKRGHQSWKDVEDHIKWLRELRGYE